MCEIFLRSNYSYDIIISEVKYLGVTLQFNRYLNRGKRDSNIHRTGCSSRMGNVYTWKKVKKHTGKAWSQKCLCRQKAWL